MFKMDVTVVNPTGLHARPASDFVSKAKSYESKISIRRSGTDVPAKNAKSIVVVLAMGLAQGNSVELIAEGPDEEKAVTELAELIRSGFGEI